MPTDPVPPGAPGSRGITALVPGLAATALAVAVAVGVTLLLPVVSPLTVALLLGVAAGNLGLLPAATGPGVRLAARRLLRLGIVVLGLRLSLPQVAQLGLPVLAVVVVTVAIAFVVTLLLSRLLRLPGDLGLLLATGFSICGASAIAAVTGVTRSKESEVVTAVSLVTLFGSLAIVVLPLLQHPFGLDDHLFGLWVGASVHDVAQTVAAASVAGPLALAAAVVVKLTRVVLLAPLVAGIALVRRRAERAAEHAAERAAEHGAGAPAAGTTLPPLVPLFVVGFLAAVGLRSTGLLSPDVLAAAQHVETVLLAAAMFALGTSVRILTLVRTAGRAAAVGVLSFAVIAGVALLGVRLVG